MAATASSNPVVPLEAPLFLRKTYAMMDSCDPAIGGWSEDGTTFVIKHTKAFEQDVIPQFFKHSKFSSFVRQLNFYSFRKLKYSENAIRVEEEEATAQYWRFHHAKFQRGKPELLLEMKRTNSTPRESHIKQNSSNNNSIVPDNATSNPFATSAFQATTTTATSAPTDAAMKQELEAMKQRMEEMSRNMTELSSMVQRVSLTGNNSTTASSSNSNHNVAASAVAAAVKAASASNSPQVGHKRKKLVAMTDICAVPEPVLSNNMTLPLSSDESLPLPPELVASTNDLSFPTITTDEHDDMNMELDPPLPPVQLETLHHHQPMAFSTDDALVDLTVRNTDDCIRPDDAPLSGTVSPTNAHDNRPDPALMDRLSDALAVLPKDMQEQIVERLIAAILSTDASSLLQPSNTTDGGMPLCAATVAALLTHYSAAQCRGEQESKGKSASKKNGVNKSIPVIPVHA